LNPNSSNPHHPAGVYLVWATVATAAAMAVILALNLLWLQPFHHDEALYATWARQISSGTDVWLTHTPVDKPPLFIYLTAGAMKLLGETQTAARLVSIFSGGLTVVVVFVLARKLYGTPPAIVAAWLVALSPFMILFTPTAFTDSLLVLLILASAAAAAYRRAGLAAVFLGLALATKQQALFFIPLILAILVISAYSNRERIRAATMAGLIRFTIALLISLLPLFLWELFRGAPATFLKTSLDNYGGLTVDLAAFAERWSGFIGLLTYGTAAPILNGTLVWGIPLLLLLGWWFAAPASNEWLFDWVFVFFSGYFLLLHAALSFQVWDRYLLGLVPLLAILLSRIFWLPAAIVARAWPAGQRYFTTIWAGVLVVLLLFTMPGPVQNASNGRYPLGSQSDALRGISQTANYLQGKFGAGTTLYHHWLGTHWRFYLAGAPYDLQYWDTPAELADRAEAGHLIAFPTNQSDTMARLALADAGFHLRPLFQAYAPNGQATVMLYQIEAN
jgi:4-amino-4-deoxy-L-arabinose transferase-like glycosyltransferase